MFPVALFDLVFLYSAKGLVGRNVSKMTYFVSDGTRNLDSINVQRTRGQLRFCDFLWVVDVSNEESAVTDGVTTSCVSIHHAYARLRNTQC